MDIFSQAPMNPRSLPLASSFSNQKKQDFRISKKAVREQSFSLDLRTKPVGWSPSMAGDSW